jgi:hypothetical protein
LESKGRITGAREKAKQGIKGSRLQSAGGSAHGRCSAVALRVRAKVENKVAKRGRYNIVQYSAVLGSAYKL